MRYLAKVWDVPIVLLRLMVAVIWIPAALLGVVACFFYYLIRPFVPKSHR